MAENSPTLDPDAVQGLKQYVETYTGNSLSSGSGGGINVASLIACFIFSSVGFVVFMYGKKMASWRPMIIGIALMVYPYFISNTIAVYLIGFALCAVLYFFRE